MKILVIGGTRFFGKRLVHLLIKQGHQVFVLTRGNQADDFGDSVTRLKADRTNKSELASVIGDQKFDTVVDQLCMSAQEIRDAIEIFKDKIQFYLLTSTMAVYEQRGNLREEDFDALKYQPEPEQSYATGKRAAERELALQSYFPYGVVRIPIVLGTDDYTERLLNHVRRIQNGLPLHFPNLETHFSFIDAQDAAHGLAWLVENRHEGAFNFSSEDTILLRDLVALIEKATGKKAVLTDSPSPEASSSFGVPHDWYLNVNKVKTLGFKTKDLKAWLPELIQTYANR